MVYLILAILATITINAMIKVYEVQGANRHVVLASNYVVASLLGWAFALARGIDGIERTTILLGLGGGLLWPVTIFLQMWGVRQYGISLAGTVSRLSLSIPVLFAVFFLSERLTLVTGLGVLCCFIAFFLLAPIKPESGNALDRRSVWTFPLLVLCFGLVDLWANLFNTLGRQREQSLFILLIFTASGILSWGAVIVNKITVDRASVARGICLGVPNFFSTWFLLEGLKSPFFSGRSAIAYALYSIVPATLIFSMGPIIWREKITRGNVAGFIVALAAIALLVLW